jgi:hypothetical protein
MALGNLPIMKKLLGTNTLLGVLEAVADWSQPFRVSPCRGLDEGRGTGA